MRRVVTSVARTTNGPRLAVLGVACLSAIIFQQCAPAPQPAPEPSKNEWAADVKPTLTIRELMEHFIDPTADFIFDAVVFDLSVHGTTTTAPANDDEWAKVERGAWQLAESANLLMIPRKAEPPGRSTEPAKPGVPAPELSGAEIEAKIDADRPRWNRHADDLRTAALEAIQMVKARNADAVINAGTRIDKACESCHLEYWYPGDRNAVEADAKKKVTFDPPGDAAAKDATARPAAPKAPAPKPAPNEAAPTTPAPTVPPPTAPPQ
jgi:hypothetical protein